MKREKTALKHKTTIKWHASNFKMMSLETLLLCAVFMTGNFTLRVNTQLKTKRVLRRYNRELETHSRHQTQHSNTETSSAHRTAFLHVK